MDMEYPVADHWREGTTVAIVQLPLVRFGTAALTLSDVPGAPVKSGGEPISSHASPYLRVLCLWLEGTAFSDY